MIPRLRDALHPRRIILFGSDARGTPGPDSDLDLLVVCDTLKDPFEATVRAIRACADLSFPKDILVTDEERLRRRVAMPHTIEATAVAEGKVVYAL
jgi:predicted nucleotidyltransferase